MSAHHDGLSWWLDKQDRNVSFSERLSSHLLILCGEQKPLAKEREKDRAEALQGQRKMYHVATLKCHAFQVENIRSEKVEGTGAYPRDLERDCQVGD